MGVDPKIAEHARLEDARTGAAAWEGAGDRTCPSASGAPFGRTRSRARRGDGAGASRGRVKPPADRGALNAHVDEHDWLDHALQTVIATNGVLDEPERVAERAGRSPTDSRAGEIVWRLISTDLSHGTLQRVGAIGLEILPRLEVGRWPASFASGCWSEGSIEANSRWCSCRCRGAGRRRPRNDRAYLGHANTRATEIYLHADLALKERALARTAPTPAATRRYRPPDTLLAFLEAL